MAVDQSLLNFIVGQSLYLLEIDPLTGPEKAGYTLREFGMYVLARVHQNGYLEDDQLNQEFLEQVKTSLEHIAKHGIRGDAIQRAKMVKEGPRPKQR